MTIQKVLQIMLKKQLNIKNKMVVIVVQGLDGLGHDN